MREHRAARSRHHAVLAGAAVLLLAGGASGAALAGWQQYHGGGLWRVIQRCAVTADHHPCTRYEPGAGHVLLKDRDGQGQYLLMPSRPLRGIEEDALLQPETPDYLQKAWDYRQLVAQAYGRSLPDEALSLAVNSRRGRSQEQLHVHLDCLRRDVRDRLAHLPAGRQGEIRLRGHHYRWWRLPSLTPSPFLVVPFFPAGADRAERSRYGLAVTVLHGQFILLQSRAHWLDRGHAEELQDHQCKP